MALSYYSNWDSFQQLDSSFELHFPDEWNYDYFFDQDDLFLAENPNSLLSNAVSYNNFNPIATDFEPFHYQKRQKGSETEYPVFPCFSAETECPVLPCFSELAMPEFSTAAPVKGGGSLSAQSVAARQRRRRITEKTQELGKLVPGGQKMNTAEMLQSAYKYIKFLQAQVSLLGLIQEEEIECSEDFQILVGSPLIQEKLSSSENCLVPQKFIEKLSSDNQTSHLVPSVKKEH